MKYGSKLKILIFFNSGLIILDRFSKWLILKFPDLYQNSLIELKLFKNQKLFFTSLDQKIIYILIGVVLLLFLFLLFKSLQKKDILLIAGSSLIILGGLSNFFDRIIYCYVIDWIRIFFLPISIFNIADLMIISGIICLILALIKSK